MIDTHCHLDHKQFDQDRNEALKRAFEGGMTHLVIPAIEPTRFDGVLALAESDERIVCGMGIHPHDALQASDEALRRVEELSHNERVRAIGEIGLDYHYNFAPPEVQKEVFRQQIRIAKRRNLPIIVHNRESDDDVMNILTEEQDGTLRGVLHCFSGTPEQAARAVELGFHVSFTGNITFKKSSLSETVASVPMNTIMIETDAPYMTPVPHRGKRNEPLYVGLVAEKIAEIRSMSLSDVLQQTTQTAKNFFRLNLVLFAIVTTLLAASFSSLAIAQTSEEEEEYVEPPNPFPKLIGVGGVFGANTLTDFNSRGTQSPYEGQALGPGGSLVVYLSNHWAINASYLYGINRTVTNIDPRTGMSRQDRPNEHQAFDLSVQYNVNPWNILNFYFMLGGSYLTNNINLDGVKGYLGFHVNLIGIGVNIKTPIGLLYPCAEYRANLVIGLRDEFKQYGPGDTRQLYGFVFSVPRVGLYFFPNFSGK